MIYRSDRHEYRNCRCPGHKEENEDHDDGYRVDAATFNAKKAEDQFSTWTTVKVNGAQNCGQISICPARVLTEDVGGAAGNPPYSTS